MTATSTKLRTVRRQLRMARAPSPRDVAEAVKGVANALLDARRAPDETAALDHLRLQLHADHAFLWLFDGAHASCALHAGHGDIADSLVIGDGAEVAARLRANGTVLCRFGEVSGLERFVPVDCRSYAVAAAPHHADVTAVLVIAWPDAEPPCDDADAAYLKIAAALLATVLSHVHAPEARVGLSDAITASIASRIVVVDRAGVIVSVNAAWTAFATRHQLIEPDSSGVGLNYLDVCRHAGAAGCSEATAVIEGIESVCSGTLETFSTSYTCDLLDEERWWMVSVTPLRHAAGGAVIEHIALSHPTVDDVAQRMGNRLFERLADTAPVPIWIAATDGRLLYSNQRWSSTIIGTEHERMWTDAVHPNDRGRASAVFRWAVSRRERFQCELRVKSADGSYRWWSCRAAPRYTDAGDLECYVGVCSDATAKRRWKSAFEHVAGKLVAAQESERIRIARELHDDLGQQTAVLASKLDVLLQKGWRGHKVLRTGLAEIRSGMNDMATAIHSLSHQLHPAKLRLLGLVPTLEALCREESGASGVAVRFASSNVPHDLSEQTALCLFRVAQEGVRNALKHSGASAIDVTLSTRGSHIVLEVSDNGSGFDPLMRSAGLGLLTMRERALLVGGVLTVQASPPHGATIQMVVPLTRDPDVTPPHRSPDAGAPLPVSVPARPARRASAG